MNGPIAQHRLARWNLLQRLCRLNPQRGRLGRFVCRLDGNSRMRDQASRPHRSRGNRLEAVGERSATDFSQIVPVVRNAFGPDSDVTMRAAQQTVQPSN
ncbi:MAG: hypothetical protein WDZ59_10380 [Pirellulales bacterium]